MLFYSRVLGAVLGLLRVAGIDPGASTGAAQLLWHILVEFPTVALVLPYLYLATRRVYGQGGLTGLLKTVTLVISLTLITIAYRLILFWLTFLTV